MSIEREEGGFVVTCDICGDTLEPEYDWNDAVSARKEEGWKSVKSYDGDWYDYCPECYKKMHSAADDFRGVFSP